MKISILTENTAAPYFLAEFGFSCFIETNGNNFLFDLGATDIYLKNAEKLGIDIDNCNNVILSHGHWDHGNGLKYIKGKNLLCHPGAFRKRYHKGDDNNIGLEMTKEEIETNFCLTSSAKPYYIDENIIFLGEIPRLNDFESKESDFILSDGSEDFVSDDTAMAIVEDGRLIIISGCAHSGICNIIEYARNISGISDVKAVLGGFHLKNENRQLDETIKYFKKLNAKQLYPCHCTQLPAMAAFYNNFKINRIMAGNTLEI